MLPVVFQNSSHEETLLREETSTNTDMIKPGGVSLGRYRQENWGLKGQPWQHSKLETSLGCVRSCLKTKILTQNNSDDFLKTGCNQIVFCFGIRLENENVECKES